jgi:hypothetical protein
VRIAEQRSAQMRLDRSGGVRGACRGCI